MLKVQFEQEDDTNQWFAHLASDEGIFGLASVIQGSVPKGVYVTVPPRLQPGVTWYLVSKCGFEYLWEYPLDGEMNDILVKR